MPSFSETISITTQGFSDIIDLTASVLEVLDHSGIHDGLVTVFCPGSTGAVTTIEYESGVLKDLRAAIERLAPSNVPYEHDRRWEDGNGFSHVRAALCKASLTVPFADRSLLLGTWQQIVLVDFDNRPRQRSIILQFMGE